MPGSHIVGAIDLGGGGDTVNVRARNQNLTFNTFAGATVTSNMPFVVAGNRVVTIDPTSFGTTDRNLMDFMRGLSAAIPDIDVAASGSAPLAFAAPESAAGRVGDAATPACAWRSDLSGASDRISARRHGRAGPLSDAIRACLFFSTSAN